MAHRGELPLPPWGWLTLTDSAPEVQQLADPAFEAAGNRVLTALAEYRASNNLPSLSAAVAISGRLVWAGAVGFSDDGDQHAASARLATFYFTDGSRFRAWRAVDLSHRLPGGGYVSSPTDLVKVGQHYFGDHTIDAQTREMFWEPQRLADGSVNEQDYALGWRWREFEIEEVGVVRNANHGGVSRGSQCWLLLYTDYKLSMAFCTNTKTAAFETFGSFYEPFFTAFIGA